MKPAATAEEDLRASSGGLASVVADEGALSYQSAPRAHLHPAAKSGLIVGDLAPFEHRQMAF